MQIRHNAMVIINYGLYIMKKSKLGTMWIMSYGL